MVTASYARSARRSSRLGAALALLVFVAACSATQRTRTRSDTLVGQAEAAEQARDYTRARSLYRRAKRAAANSSIRARIGRKFALTLVFWGEYGAAQRELEAVVRLRPDDAPSWHDLGIIRHRRGDEAGSEHALRQAVRIEPKEPRSRIALAALLTRGRRWRAALAEYQGLLTLRLPGRIRAKVKWAMRAIEREMSRP